MAASYPLVFSFRDVIEGNGFLAGVAISGRALMVHEGEDGWWLYGVTPAGIAATGDTPPEAHAAFRNTYREVLFDAAADAADFEAFKTEVERFFNEGNSEEERRWNEAAAAIRSGQVTPEAFFSELPRIPADSCPLSLTVERLDTAERKFSYRGNTLDRYAITVAAA